MLTAVLALLLLRAPLMLQSLDTLDESLVLVYAQEVLDGRVTHRDFFTVHGPAQFWLVAAFFKALGASLWTERVVGLLLQVLVVVGMHRLTRRWGRSDATLAAPFALCASPPWEWLPTLGWADSRVSSGGWCFGAAHPSPRGHSASRP